MIVFQKHLFLDEIYFDLNLDLKKVEEQNKNTEEFRYVLVDNIIDKHYFGENKEIRSGTKHFRAGAKVYLLPEYGGNGHNEIPVYGLPRKRSKKILITMRSSMIKNLRVKKTYDKKVIQKIDSCFFYLYLDHVETTLKELVD